MNSGDMVKIYQDPQTCEKLEGKAILLEQLSRSSLGIQTENWVVRFTSDGMVVNRWVNIAYH